MYNLRDGRRTGYLIWPREVQNSIGVEVGKNKSASEAHGNCVELHCGSKLLTYYLPEGFYNLPMSRAWSELPQHVRTLRHITDQTRYSDHDRRHLHAAWHKQAWLICLSTNTSVVNIPVAPYFNFRELTGYAIPAFFWVAPSFPPEVPAAAILGLSYHFIHVSKDAHAKPFLWGKPVPFPSAQTSVESVDRALKI